MALVALITLGGFAETTVGCYYAVFFFGVIEVSSIPLVIVDLFHPKHGSWAAFEQRGGDGSRWLPGAVLFSRGLFAALYLVVRAAYFPFVIAFQVNPDIMQVLAMKSTKDDRGLQLMLHGMAVFGIAFALLQLYWALLVVRQVVKVTRGGSAKQERQD
jgi:cytochrome bd-type quinol oxidase subunit 2